MKIKYAVISAAFIATLIAIVWLQSDAMEEIPLSPTGDDAEILVFFPVVEIDGDFHVLQSYKRQIDFVGYNAANIDPDHPGRASSTWYYRPVTRASRYGLVLRRWPIGGSLDNSDVRVFWLRPNPSKDSKGRVVIPPFEELPAFDLGNMSPTRLGTIIDVNVE